MSFFNNESEKEFWIREKTFLNSLKSHSHAIVLKAVFKKQGKLLKKAAYRWYYLLGNYLLYSEKDDISQVKGAVDLTFVYMQVDQGFVFSRNFHWLHLEIDSIFQKCIWEEKLRHVCILGTFLQEFSILEQIGQGKFSTVHRCKRLKDDLDYAVKVISKKVLLNKEALNGFKNEIRCLRNIRENPHVLKLYYVYEDLTNFYLVMEYLNGGEIQDLLTLSYQHQRAMIKQLLVGLAWIHDHGIMHRDIKPQNIVLRQNYIPVYVDFGLATFYDRLDQTILKCGTPGFVAPEVLNYQEGKKIYKEKCDVYSLGLTIFVLMYGYNPFCLGDAKSASLKKNAEGRVDFPMNSAIPRLGIMSEYHSMLSKYPKERISAKQALNHPYFQDVTVQNSEELSYTPEIQFQSKGQLQKMHSTQSKLRFLQDVHQARSLNNFNVGYVYVSCDGQSKSQQFRCQQKQLRQGLEHQNNDWSIPENEQPQLCKQLIVKSRATSLRQALGP